MERLRNTYNKYWYAWAMVIPVVLVLAVLVFYPLFQGVWMSFTNINEANQVGEVCTKSLGGAETCAATRTGSPARSWLRNSPARSCCTRHGACMRRSARSR